MAVGRKTCVDPQKLKKRKFTKKLKVADGSKIYELLMFQNKTLWCKIL